MRLIFCIVAFAATILGGALSYANVGPEPSLPINHKWQIVELSGHAYRFPAGEEELPIKYFGEPNPYGVEISIPRRFWVALWNKVAPIQGWMAYDDGHSWPFVITIPDQLFQWKKDVPPPLPPVRGPVRIDEVRDGMRIWQSLDPEIWIDGLLYITFDGHSDIYGKCTRRDLDNPANSCDIYWRDDNLIHHLFVAGDWVNHAPALVDEYRRAVKVR